jgi:peptidoglycan/LPS O-acetylase OafA/YrhL
MAVQQVQPSHNKYRPEIDGLRAIAVTSVLIFHFYPKVLPDGYLGVDLFFVISGYLISLYIITNTNNSTFSFFEFYIRRIKRILPVTFLVLTVTLLVASITLIGSDFDNFLKSIIATLTFAANIYFWREGGTYFAANDALKPLIHMWSLGVEEQFYLFFPCILVFILKFLKSFYFRLLSLSVFLLSSFIANYYLIEYGGKNPAFFLTPFRAWQFGAGVFAALFYSHYELKHTRVELILSISILIVGLYLLPNFIVPGFLVSIATAYFLSKKYVFVSFIDLYFSNNLICKIGLISFSLYLWHWPILVFLRYVTIDYPSEFQIIFGILLSFIFSYLSWKFVEEPFRRYINIFTTIKILLSIAFFLITTSIVCLLFDSIRDAKSPAAIISKAIQTHYRCDVNQFIPYGGSRACLINKDSVLPYHLALIGNSHAQMYTPSLQKILNSRGESGILIPLNGCLPTTDINISMDCLRLSKLNYNAFISDKNIKVIILSLTWYSDEYFDDQGRVIKDANKLILSKSLLGLIQQLRDTGRDVYLVGPIKIPGYDLASVLSRKIKFSNLSNAKLEESLRISKDEFDRDFKDSLSFLESNLGSSLLRPDNILCDIIYCYFGDLNGVYFSDKNHLSRYGVAKMNNLFIPVFEKN